MPSQTAGIVLNSNSVTILASILSIVFVLPVIFYAARFLGVCFSFLSLIAGGFQHVAEIDEIKLFQKLKTSYLGS
jgi:hypothetical protein